MDLAIDKIRMLIVEARRLEVKEAATDPDAGSNAIDDGFADVLADQPGDEGGRDGAEEEMRGLVAGLNVDEAADLLALVYVGRGDMEPEDWALARMLAAERLNAATLDLADYLLGIPDLGDLLDEALSAMGETVADREAGAPDLEETEPADGAAAETARG